MSRQTDDATEEVPEYAEDRPGIKSPGFVTRAVFDETADENIHIVRFPDSQPHSRGDGSILIRAVFFTDEGGIVTYDDGVHGFRRLFLDPEKAIREFRETVVRTAEQRGGFIPEDSRGSPPVPQYDPGFDPVKFDDVDVEVQGLMSRQTDDATIEPATRYHVGSYQPRHAVEISDPRDFSEAVEAAETLGLGLNEARQVRNRGSILRRQLG